MTVQHLISLASFKGGVGKTTVAVHLAGYLAARAPTCVVDGDRTRNATFWHAGLSFSSKSFLSHPVSTLLDKGSFSSRRVSGRERST